jgi:hypothetical protein
VNAPPCYVICTLPLLFKFKSFINYALSSHDRCQYEFPCTCVVVRCPWVLSQSAKNPPTCTMMPMTKYGKAASRPAALRSNFSTSAQRNTDQRNFLLIENIKYNHLFCCMHSKSCDIWHLWDHTVARYNNFALKRTLYLVYLSIGLCTTSWTALITLSWDILSCSFSSLTEYHHNGGSRVD